MRSPFHSLSRAQIAALAESIAAGRLQPPFTSAALQRYAAREDAAAVARELHELHSGGLQPQHLAYLLRAILAEREVTQRLSDRLELVCTGPEQQASTSRDTGVVVRELFSRARESVDVVGFAVHQGRAVFKPLADNMTSRPELRVRLFLNVGRKYSDTRPSTELLREFAHTFAAAEWPGERMPRLYHDPRSLSNRAGPRASLHGKCVAVDDEWLFVTSANFTEAAHERNIEVGVVIQDRHVAMAMRNHLDGLIATSAVELIPAAATN